MLHLKALVIYIVSLLVQDMFSYQSMAQWSRARVSNRGLGGTGFVKGFERRQPALVAVENAINQVFFNFSNLKGESITL